MHKTDFERLRDLFRTSDRLKMQVEIQQLIDGLQNTEKMEYTFFFHPLGFVYTVLHSFQDGESIRLHIWNKKFYDITPMLDIHGHYYKVKSYVYCGCVMNQLYSLNDIGGIEVSQYKGSYPANGDRTLTKIKEGLFVLKEDKEVHCGGELYTIGHDQIHSGGAFGGLPACTVVYTQDPRDKHTQVFGINELKEQISFPKTRVPEEVLKSIFEDLDK